MNVRRGDRSDFATVRAFLDAGGDELWQRPWPRDIVLDDDFLADAVVLVAEEDGDPVGCAFGVTKGNKTAHLNYLYVRPDRRRHGVARALLREFVADVRGDGAEHVTLDVDTTNDVGRAVWQRLGFTEWARRLSSSVAALELRLGEQPAGESYGWVYVQTDDAAEVDGAVRKYLPRIGAFAATGVEAPQNGWTAVGGDVGGDPQALRRLAQELSFATGAVALALGVEDGAVVRYVLFERGSVVDEYLSVPEYFGELPPGDVVALGANPTVVGRLTGADPARVRTVARTASLPGDLPPAPELLAQIAEVIGLTIPS